MLDLAALRKWQAPDLFDLQAKLEAEGLTLVEQHEALTRHQKAFEQAARKLAHDETVLIERAVRGWAEQCGASVEEWAKYYGYRTERVFVDAAAEGQLPSETHTVQIAVHPVLLRDEPPWRTVPVVFPQPPRGRADR